MFVSSVLIDRSKCTTPYDCKKCIQKCNQMCFLLLQSPEKFTEFKEMDKKKPHNFLLIHFYKDVCIGCGDCVEICPVEALRLVHIDGREVPSARIDAGLI